MTEYLITGVAGFIGFNLAKFLIEKGHNVYGIDNLNNYYDVRLKHKRLDKLHTLGRFSFKEADIANASTFERLPRSDILIHLAAQAGVRHSIEKPADYVQSNLIGTFNIMEHARQTNIKHLLAASTSSVYGETNSFPLRELTYTDHPLSFYAATKKSNEVMTHSYAHVFNIPTTMFRFFTVYGPWGRPDMALFKFVRNIIQGQQIDVYNYGKMERDFTYIDDLVNAIYLLSNVAPVKGHRVSKRDSLSPVAPHRTVNIGNASPVELMDYVKAIEVSLGIKANINFMDMQIGDVAKTHASSDLLFDLTGYRPDTDVNKGVENFVNWIKLEDWLINERKMDDQS